jgi:hypothetical protein
MNIPMNRSNGGSEERSNRGDRRGGSRRLRRNDAPGSGNPPRIIRIQTPPSLRDEHQKPDIADPVGHVYGDETLLEAVSIH